MKTGTGDRCTQEATPTNVLAWWDPRIYGWRCAQCDQRLGDGVHVRPVDRPGRVNELSLCEETSLIAEKRRFVTDLKAYNDCPASPADSLRTEVAEIRRLAIERKIAVLRGMIAARRAEIATPIFRLTTAGLVIRAGSDPASGTR